MNYNNIVIRFNEAEAKINKTIVTVNPMYHSQFLGLDYESSGHTGFASSAELYSDYANSLDISQDETSGIVTIKLLNKSGEVIATKDLDLDTEHIIKSVSLDLENKKIIFLMQDKSTIECDITALLDTLYLKINVVQTNLEAETTRATTKEQELSKDISDEAEARLSQDTAIKELITAESNARITADNDLSKDISQEIKDRGAADSSLSNAINAEAIRASNEESNLNTLITTEVNNRTDADSKLDLKISNEATTRQTADGTLQALIESEKKARTNKDTELETALNEEISARKDDRSHTDSEVERLDTNITNLIGNLSTEIDNRVVGDEALDTNKLDKVTDTSTYNRVYTIDTNGKQTVTNLEKNGITAGSVPVRNDNGNIRIGLTPINFDDATSKRYVDAVNDKVKIIEGKIPDQATSTNQLADKDFVNSSINSVSAYYITKNAAGDAFSTKAELLSTTTYYSGGQVRVPTRNDYALIQADETLEDATTRYSYQNGNWEFQYKVNNTPFTEAQLKAINSGITTDLVSNLNTIYDDYLTSEDKKELNTAITNETDARKNADDLLSASINLESATRKGDDDALWEAINAEVDRAKGVEGKLDDLTTDAKTNLVSAINEVDNNIDTHAINSNIHVTTANKEAWNAKYDKPTDGIPKSDLTSAVQTSLGKADSAVQDSSYVHTDNNYTTTDKNKLSGIAEGADVNVNADWNAISGDAEILNKPTTMKNPNSLTVGSKTYDGSSAVAIDKSDIGLGSVENKTLDKNVTASSDNYITSGAVKSYVDENGGKIDTISVNGAQQTISDKKNVDITVPTNISDLTNDDNTVKDSSYKHITVTEKSVSDGTTTFTKYDDTAIKNNIDNKVDKVTGSSLVEDKYINILKELALLNIYIDADGDAAQLD